MKLSKYLLFSLALLLALPATAQQAHSNVAASASTAVPPLIPYSGVVGILPGAQPATTTSITFLIYKDEIGGEPLFTETQSITLDTTGHYKAQLGATNPNGLPADLFATGEARWLEVQVAGEAPQSRVLLVSVPYALKAADAATLGGLPPSAFALARSASEAIGAVSSAIIPNITSNVTTTGGTLGFVPKFSGTSSVIDSPIFVGSTGAVGIGTITPTATLTVDGAMTITGTSVLNGQVLIPSLGTATASQGFNSQFIKLSSSAFNSSSMSVVSPRFQLQVEPTGNDTASPKGTLNVLASATTAAPVETGLFINTNGTIHFAPGQTFPGTGSGTITGVTAGTALTGGGTSGTVTLNVDTTKVPLLTAANTFHGNQTITGNATVNGSLTATEGISAPLGIGTSKPAYDLEVYSPTANVAQLAMVSNGSDAAISANNTANGGREYWIDSGSGSTSVGAGNFAIWDQTAKAARLVVNPTGQVGIGTITPNGQLAVQADVSIGDDAIVAEGVYADGFGTAGIFSNGADTDNSSGSTGGDGGYFVGGAADTAADAGYGIYVQGGYYAPYSYGLAAYFDPGIEVNGTVVDDVSSSKIDHPLDPATKYLVHATVQSSEMMNIYTGNVTTDELGLATVKLPDWFEAENADFRYQLTVIGQFAQAIVKDKVANGQFRIMTNASHVEVSWQITAVRQDAYAKAHPLVVVQQKPANERGFYQNPELFGQPAEKQTEWGRHPQQMQRMKQMQEQQRLRTIQHQAPTLSHDQPARAVNKGFAMSERPLP